MGKRRISNPGLNISYIYPMCKKLLTLSTDEFTHPQKKSSTKEANTVTCAVCYMIDSNMSIIPHYADGSCTILTVNNNGAHQGAQMCWLIHPVIAYKKGIKFCFLKIKLIMLVN